jgi:hypothetical protein
LNILYRFPVKADAMPDGDTMNTTMPMDRSLQGLRTTGNVALWIAAASLLAVLLCSLLFFAILRADSGMGGPIAALGVAMGPYLGVVVSVALTLQLLAIAALAIGAVRWHFSFVRNPRWIASGICTSLAVLTSVALALLFVVIVTSPA